jgi:O-antigen ligase
VIVPPAAFVFFAAAVFLYALRRPERGILLPLVFHSLYLVRSHIGVLPTTGLEVLMISCLLGVLVGSPGVMRTVLLAMSPRVRLLLALFLVAATLSAIIAPHPRTAWGVWKAMVVEPMLYATVLATLLHRRRVSVPSVAWALVAGGLASVSASLVAGNFGPDFSRFRGIYDVPNSFALVLAPLTIVALTLALHSSASRARRAAGVCTAVFGGVLIATQSLAGIAACAVTALLVSRRSQQSRWVAGGVLAFVLVSALVFGASGRLSHLFDPVSSSIRARAQLWQVSVALIRDHPLLGTGLGTFEPAYQEKLHAFMKQARSQPHFAEAPRGKQPVASSTCALLATSYCLLPPLEWVVRDPHNILLSFWLNTGVLGLISMGGLSYLVLRARSQPHFAEAPRDKQPVASSTSSPTAYWLLTTGFQAALLTLLVFGLFDVPYWKNDLALLWWAYLLTASVSVPPRHDVSTAP